MTVRADYTGADVDRASFDTLNLTESTHSATFSHPKRREGSDMSADTNNDSNVNDSSVNDSRAARKISPEQLPEQLRGLLDNLLGFARAAEAVAQRLVGKVRTVAVLGLTAAAWLTYACVETFDLSLMTALIVAVVLFVVPAVLWKLHGTLHSVIGLPQRVTDTAARMTSKATEYRAYYQSLQQTRADPDQSKRKPTLRQLWNTGKSILDAKALGGEAQELVAQVGGALALTNPIFAIALGIASAVSLLLFAIAMIVGLAYLF
jgi:ABC-type multidrug transport system fused ATPase/permease subunit